MPRLPSRLPAHSRSTPPSAPGRLPRVSLVQPPAAADSVPTDSPARSTASRLPPAPPSTLHTPEGASRPAPPPVHAHTSGAENPDVSGSPVLPAGPTLFPSTTSSGQSAALVAPLAPPALAASAPPIARCSQLRTVLCCILLAR